MLENDYSYLSGQVFKKIGLKIPEWIRPIVIHLPLIEDSLSMSNKVRATNSIKMLIDDSLLPKAVANVDREVEHHKRLGHYKDSTENHKPLA